MSPQPYPLAEPLPSRVAAADLRRVLRNAVRFADRRGRGHVRESVNLRSRGEEVIASATDERVFVEDRAPLLDGDDLPARLLHVDDARRLVRILGDYEDLVVAITPVSTTAMTVQVAGDTFRIGNWANTTGYPDMAGLFAGADAPGTADDIHVHAHQLARFRKVAGPSTPMTLRGHGPGKPVHVRIGATFRAVVMPATATRSDR